MLGNRSHRKLATMSDSMIAYVFVESADALGLVNIRRLIR